MKKTELITDYGTVVLQIIEPDTYGFTDQFNAVYDDIEIRIQTENKIFHHKPLYYLEDSKVTEGYYTFEISLSLLNSNKIQVKRVK